jgi:hypothetical protein
METWWSECDSDALERKDSQAVTLELVGIYATLTPEERLFADHILGEWLGSEEERKRFDALVVIREYRIRSAAPHLRALETELEKSTDPGAPFQLRKVRALLAVLGSD